MKEGTEKLEQLHNGEKDIVKWGPNKMVSRNDPQGLEEKALRTIFKVKPFSLPAYTGVMNSQGGFSLVRISKVIEAASPDEEKVKVFSRQLQQLYAQEELTSYLAAIKQRSDVTVMRERIENKQ